MGSTHRHPGRATRWAILLLAAWAWTAETATDRTHLVCALPADFAPTCFKDHGQPTGFAVEVLDEVARRSGLQIDYIFGRPWDELQDMLVDRRADLIAALVVTPERQQRFIFTCPLETIAISYVVRTDQPPLRGPLPGMKVGAIARSASEEVAQRHGGLEIVRFGSLQHLLLELIAGRLDMAICPKANLLKLAEDTGLAERIRFLEPPAQESKRAIALRPEDVALRDRLDAVMTGFIGTPVYQAIFQRWWGQPRPWWTASRVALAMGALLAAVAASLLGWRFNSLRTANQALRRSQETLRDSEALLRQSQRVALVGHYVLDTATGRWSGSSALDDIFGITDPFERDIAAWQELLHPDDRDMMSAYLREQVLGKHLLFDREYRIIRRSDGAERWVHGLGTVERTDGRAVRMFGTIQDITERKRSAALEKEASVRLEALFQGARDAILIADPAAGTILDVNRQAEALLGRPRHDLIGIHQSHLHPAELREEIRTAFAEHAAGAIRPVETAVLHQDGSRIPVEICSSVIDLPGGRSLLMGMFRDIRERVRLQEQLRQSEKMTAIGQLAGGVAHDFNNQLAGISGYAELLAKKLADPQQRSWATGILGATQRAAELTRQLLAFARKGQSQRAATDLRSIIADVVDLLRRSIDPRIVIRQDLVDAPCLTLGDPGQLHHVLLNLALNARDAMPGGGELTFATRIFAPDAGSNQAGSQVEIAVGDTGCGMDPETLRHVFEPFFTTKAPGKGTGLGLAAVYGVVENHGGTITVASTPGHGSTFTIRLPLIAAPVATPPNRPAITLPSCPPSVERHIMVIDDDAVVRDISHEMLLSLGFAVTTCASADEALAQCRRNLPCDLVILDLIMPRIGGRDAFLALRAVRPDLRVLLASGHSLNGEVQSILDLGAISFIQKPFLLAELAKAVGTALTAAAKPPPDTAGGAGSAGL